METSTCLTLLPAYESLRILLYNQAQVITDGFIHINDEQKCMFILSKPDIARLTTKSSYRAIQVRYDTLYK